MCGIVGFIRRPTNAGSPLEPMMERVVHRGPDARGSWGADQAGWRVEFGHRRLTIIDLETGAQPMLAGDRVCITYNGEVYNFAELRQPLEQSRWQFKSRSDTEVVAAHIGEHGTKGLPDLNGMFAFALFDKRDGSLVLARDRAGIKPLYYASLPDGGLAFASELSALLPALPPGQRISPLGLTSYLFSDYVDPPLTILEGVHKVPPGCSLTWRDGTLSPPSPYWEIPPTCEPGEHEDSLAEKTWAILGQAVERNLIADVPVGVFLSGGIDSSIIATLASERAGKRIKAFSIAFRDPTFDESSHARKVAAGLNVDFIEKCLDEDNLLAVADEATTMLDEPMADPSLLPTFLLAELAAEHVKVALGGDGGDELWAGYPTYLAHRAARLFAHVPRRVRDELARVLALVPTDDRYQSLEWKAKRFVQRFDPDEKMRHLRWMSNLDLSDLKQVAPGLGDDLPATCAAALPSSQSGLNRLLALDFTTYLPGSVLTKVDRATMAHSLEARPVFLDNAVIDWAFSLPDRYKLHGTRTKFLLKRASRNHLPGEIIFRPKKGFGIPLAQWMRGPFRDRLHHLLDDSPLWTTGLLSRTAFANRMASHLDKKTDESKPLWALYVLDRWARKHEVTA